MNTQAHSACKTGRGLPKIDTPTYFQLLIPKPSSADERAIPPPQKGNILTQLRPKRLPQEGQLKVRPEPKTFCGQPMTTRHTDGSNLAGLGLWVLGMSNCHPVGSPWVKKKTPKTARPPTWPTSGARQKYVCLCLAHICQPPPRKKKK